MQQWLRLRDVLSSAFPLWAELLPLCHEEDAQVFEQLRLALRAFEALQPGVAVRHLGQQVEVIAHEAVGDHFETKGNKGTDTLFATSQEPVKETGASAGTIDPALREYRDVYGKRWFIADSEWQSDKPKVRAFEDAAGQRRAIVARGNIVTAESNGGKAALVRKLLAGGYQLPAEQFRETESQKGWKQRWSQGWRPYGVDEDGTVVPAWEEASGQIRLTDIVDFLWAKAPPKAVSEQQPVSQPAKISPTAQSGASAGTIDKLRSAFDGLASAPARSPAVMASLPDAVIGGDLGNITGHPDYAAAKAGDNAAALRIAYDVVTPDLVERAQQAIGDEKPVVLPVMAVEQSGNNKIPVMAAQVLADRLGLPLAESVFQAAKVNRTASTGLDRVFKPVPFTGDIASGQSYLLLDDTLTQGGTFAGLANHIAAGGGYVAGIVALTGKAYSARLSPSAETLARLRETHGDIETSFQKHFGYGFNALTESEARYLANFRPAEKVRNRILESGHGPGEAVLPEEQEEGLASAPAAQQVGLPKERRGAFLDVAESLIADGVTMPEGLARALTEARPDGSLSKYSQALWDFLAIRCQA
ncbi:MAG: hypothetical protein JNM65_07120 [Verrucomicrobiaceae bacterium]|nr:hypothetical protein [Verrucomicrobiaceae bacterium]